MSEVVAGRLRSRVLQTVLAALWPVSFLAIVLAFALAVTPALVGALPIALILGVFIAARRATAPRPRIASGPVRLIDGDVVLGAEKIAERSAITSGVVVPSAAEGVVVRLERRRGSAVELAVEDVDQARRLLIALGLDPRHAVARFSILASDPGAWRRKLQTMLPLLLVFAVTVAVTARHGLPAMVPALVMIAVGLALSTIVPSQVTVGRDGISIRRFGRTEFISLDGIVDADVHDDETPLNSALSIVRLLDAEGRVVRQLVVDQKKNGAFNEGVHLAIDARAEALAVRIREVIQLRAAPESTFDPRALAQGDRDVAAWVSDLRSLLGRARGFRDAEAPTPQALLAIVEDAAARPTERVAAAIALAPNGPADRQRVRIAAEATAGPTLRIALEAAIDDDDNQLATALEQLQR